MDDQSDWHGLYTDRRGVILVKRPQLGLNTIINHFVRRFSGVFGPHLCEFLCHGKEDVRNCFSPNGLATWENSTVSVSGCKNLQVGDEI